MSVRLSITMTSLLRVIITTGVITFAVTRVPPLSLLTCYYLLMTWEHSWCHVTQCPPVSPIVPTLCCLAQNIISLARDYRAPAAGHPAVAGPCTDILCDNVAVGIKMSAFTARALAGVSPIPSQLSNTEVAGALNIKMAV